MATTYILISDKEVADLVQGKEVYFSVTPAQNETEYAIMLDKAFKDTYLGKETDKETSHG